MLSRRSWLPGAGEADFNNRKVKIVIMRIDTYTYICDLLKLVGWVVMLATMTGLTKTKSSKLTGTY